MKQLFFIWGAFLCAPLFCAPHWEAIAHFDDGIVAYIDLGSVVRTQNITSLQSLIDWHTPQENNPGSLYFSTIMHTEYDCAEKDHMKEKFLFAIDYEKPMGRGKEVGQTDGTSDWHDLSEEDMAAKFWRIACAHTAQ